MANESENDHTLARSHELDNMWQDMEQQLTQFDRDKEDFAREFGVEFEQYVEYFSKQAQDAASTADEKTLADLECQRRDLNDEFELELSQAKARHDAQKQLSKGTGARKGRRMRNMV